MTILETVERRAGKARFVIPCGFAVAVLFVLFGPYINYNATGYLDPWFYTGYFTNFSNLQRFYRETYYFSRLPWTIPGLLAFQAATPLVASLVLTVTIVATSIISLYFAVRWHYGTAPAVLASLALMTNPYFYSTAAWHYPNGASVAYAFLAAGCALRPAGRRAVNLFLTGFLLALAGFTNMSAAPMILSLLVLALWRERSLGGTIRMAGYVASGVAGATLLLAPVCKVMLGYWMFFRPQIQMARSEMGNPGELARMWGTGKQFLLDAYRLSAPFFLIVFGAAVLAIARCRKAVAFPAWAALAVCGLLYCVQEFLLHGVALRVAYVSAYLVVPLFVCAGTVMGELWGGPGGISWGVPALWILALPFLTDAHRADLFHGPMWGKLAMAGAVALLLLIGWRRNPAVFRAPVVLLLACLLYAGPAREVNLFLSAQPANREDYQAMMSLQAALKSTVRPEKPVVFWVDSGETNWRFFASAQSLWVYGAFDFTRLLTGAPAQELRDKFGSSPTMVQLTDHPEKIGEHLRLMDARGVHYENHRQWKARVGQSQFYVAVEDLTDIFGIH